MSCAGHRSDRVRRDSDRATSFAADRVARSILIKALRACPRARPIRWSVARRDAAGQRHEPPIVAWFDR